MDDVDNYVAICAIDDVTPDLPYKGRLNEIDLAVFQVEDAYYVTQDICTHGPGSLSEGYVEGAEIECPFHQGRFSIITGAPLAPPCTVPLKIWNVVMRDDQIMIDKTSVGQTAT